jgi:hypothetical protein
MSTSLPSVSNTQKTSFTQQRKAYLKKRREQELLPQPPKEKNPLYERATKIERSFSKLRLELFPALDNLENVSTPYLPANNFTSATAQREFMKTVCNYFGVNTPEEIPLNEDTHRICKNIFENLFHADLEQSKMTEEEWKKRHPEATIEELRILRVCLQENLGYKKLIDELCILRKQHPSQDQEETHSRVSFLLFHLLGIQKK